MICVSVTTDGFDPRRYGGGGGSRLTCRERSVSEIERSIFSLMNWPVIMYIYNKYIHRQFSHKNTYYTTIHESGY